MDRRQKKTREAIFQAFTSLIIKRQYNKITIQDIIDKADIGRSTFYSHFETKDDLIKSMCDELFHHITQSLFDKQNAHCIVIKDNAHHSIFYHIMRHLQEDDSSILKLLSCNDNEIVLRYFKQNMNNLLCKEAFSKPQMNSTEIPEDFLINHISSSFVEMVRWWVNNDMQPEPLKMDEYFRSVMSGAFDKVKKFKHNHIWIDCQSTD
ncbi:MAG: TetR/AcrR family transcriptional regulator [Selenomonadaceae bacterium]|nr:TetR/AcrR family transcriptional regulator [Selenomonadaceae bacterium]